MITAPPLHPCRGRARHVWRDPISAARCCQPGWTRQLREPGEHVEGDTPEVRTPAAGTGLVWVWHYDARVGEEPGQ